MTEESDRPEALDEEFRAALFELDEYLDGMPREQLGALVLPLATRWALPQAGFDLVRLRQEADTLVQATPLSERILVRLRRPGRVVGLAADAPRRRGRAGSRDGAGTARARSAT